MKFSRELPCLTSIVVISRSTPIGCRSFSILRCRLLTAVGRTFLFVRRIISFRQIYRGGGQRPTKGIRGTVLR